MLKRCEDQFVLTGKEPFYGKGRHCVRSFLGHDGYLRRFYFRTFTKLARPMTHMLKRDPFVFSEEVFRFPLIQSKENWTEAPILIAPTGSLPLNTDGQMLATSQLGSPRAKIKTAISTIHYVAKTMNEAQTHTLLRKRITCLLVNALRSFVHILSCPKALVYTDHSAFKYLLSQEGC
ncbi:reverse transcriptase domain-containing protein [Tanacetum coccineum]